ncbi:MAG: hypothetical protein K0Q73_8138 [Paenibacillus sp.]|jgi:hypothetical protein|nr:hypothetical protein [Paenibacillus sp.]
MKDGKAKGAILFVLLPLVIYPFLATSIGLRYTVKVIQQGLYFTCLFYV